MSKESILNSIRQNRPYFTDKSSVTVGIAEENVASATEFSQNLQLAGGVIIECCAEQTDKIIKEKFPAALDFTKEDIRSEYSPSTALAILDKIECAVFEGNLGVAENGAVWLEDRDLPHRILPFITQSLVLKLNREKIVSSMLEAYQKIKLSETGYGVFISGPSKTADIEQSLVYGAHGAVSLTVILTQN
jgi:L-lactate dehydrogenase complex protein LldG